MTDELLKTLEQADAKDFVECLLENLRDPVPDRRYKMFYDFMRKDPAQFEMLTAGCQAAARVFMTLFEAAEDF